MNELAKQDLLEKYVVGSLTKQEKELFQNLRTETPNFEEDITFFEKFNQVQLVFGRDELKKQLLFLENSLQKEEVTSSNMLSKLTIGLQGMVKKLHYSVEELVDLFLPEPEYQTILAYANRGAGIEVLSPENGIDASIEGLNFRLKSKLKKPIQLIVENNKKNTLLSISITSFENDFSVDVGEFIPGRYYWKLITPKETLIREFFVQKEC